ncbi:MAG: GNAT family N-acetyltransferase [Suilimivivens sp.]
MVTESGLDGLLEQRASIEKTLYAGEIKAVFTSCQDYRCDLAKEDQLLITDDAETLKWLLKEGFFAIALYHDKNREVSFPEALYVVENVEELTLKAYDEVYRRLAGLPWDILETERLLVRESTVEDVKEFYRIYGDPSVTCYMEGLFQDPDEEIAYMKSYIKQIYGYYGFGMWTVLLKSTGQVIGRAGLSIREGYELPELGFVIDVMHQRRGYAFEVCSAILNYAKEELFFEKVQALVQEKNEASLKLLYKLGFQYEKNVFENGQEYRLMRVSI